MISVQSRLQPLNGNSLRGFSIALVLFMLLTSSCKTKQVKYRPNESNKPKQEVVNRPVVKDTEPEKPKENKPDEQIESTEYIDRFAGPQNMANISMLIPFNAKSYYTGGEKLSNESERFLNFYQGFLIGIKKLESEGLTTNLKVYDTKKNKETFIQKLERIDEKNTNIVIGSYHTSNIRSLAEWSKENKVLTVSPWKSSPTVSTDNPYFFQVSPTLDMIFEFIVDHVDKSYNSANVVVVGRDNAKEKALVDKVINIKNNKINISTDYKSLILPSSVQGMTPELIQPVINTRGTTVMIVPNYKSETFVQAFLARLAVAGVDQKVVVYGMPQWLDFSSLSYGQLSNLNVRLPLDQYVDPTSYQIKDFNRQYFDRYGMIPTDNEAYKGYDIALFVGRGYKDFGSEMLLEKDGSKDDLSTLSISVDRNVPILSSGSEDPSKINFFENKTIQMCEFNDHGIIRIH